MQRPGWRQHTRQLCGAAPHARLPCTPSASTPQCSTMRANSAVSSGVAATGFAKAARLGFGASAAGCGAAVL